MHPIDRGTRIEVKSKGEDLYEVRVVEGRTESSHRVTLKRVLYQRLSGGKATPEDVLTRSFEFLLEREPKESILAEFELDVIGRYFPDFEGELKRRL